VFSEFALQDPRGYDFVRPILRENKGWALFNFTPRGYNHGFDLYDMALTNPDWFCEMLTVRDTKIGEYPVISEADVQAERDAGMSEDLIQQEFYTSFEASIPGAYYADEMRMAKQQGRVCNVPVNPQLDVCTWWDIGIDDSMALWLSQDAGQAINMVAYYEKSNEAFSHYVNWLKDFSIEHNIRYAEHVLPHDGENRNPQTGRSSVEFLKELFINKAVSGSVRCAMRPPQKKDGIESVRQILPKCIFDRVRTKEGVNALTQFRKEWNEKKRIFVHVHDWASHGADAAQTMGLAHKFRDLNRKTFIPNRVNRYRTVSKIRRAA
jgi:hypothetical protein